MCGMRREDAGGCEDSGRTTDGARGTGHRGLVRWQMCPIIKLTFIRTKATTQTTNMASLLLPTRCYYFQVLALVVTLFISELSAFPPSNKNVVSTHTTLLHQRILVHRQSQSTISTSLAASPDDNNLSGVIDLTDDDEDDIPSTSNQEVSTNPSTSAAPFLSQGELSDDPNLLSPDFKDPKQTRVIIYIILTLVPILFLVPLMIGSRDLIPLDSLPPVEMTN